jgi:hypothetical protein
VRLVKAAAQGLTASIRRWSSPWDEASIATRSIPSAGYRPEAPAASAVGRGVDARRADSCLRRRWCRYSPPRMAERSQICRVKLATRGLAVGAGDRDDGLGLRPEPERGGMGQRGARVFGDDQRGVGPASAPRPAPRPRGRSGSPPRPRASGLGRIRAPWTCVPGSAAKSVPGRPCGCRWQYPVTLASPRRRGQAKLGQGFGCSRHPWPRPLCMVRHPRARSVRTAG